MSEDEICPLCLKHYSNKYNLDSHMKRIHQRSIRTDEMIEVEELCCSSPHCKYTTSHHSDLKKHMRKCVYNVLNHQHEELLRQRQAEFDRFVVDLRTSKDIEIAELKSNLQSLRSEKDIEIARLHSERDSLKEQLEKAQRMVEHLAERAIDKPTTTNTVNNHQRITNMLCDPETYAQRTQAEWIAEVAREKFEPYFWLGQRGVAQFALDHIITTEDGKMLLCCTDPSRNRFRYLSADHRLKEDIEGRIFTKSIAIPIKSVCNEVFDNICKKLTVEKSMKTGAFAVDFIDKKIDHAHTRLIEIRDIDNDEHNQVYKSELAILLNV